MVRKIVITLILVCMVCECNIYAMIVIPISIRNKDLGYKRNIAHCHDIAIKNLTAKFCAHRPNANILPIKNNFSKLIYTLTDSIMCIED